MSTEYNAVQESIKIALDAADAATDVTSEFNKIKRDNKKLENSMKAVHRYTTIIFASSMFAAVAALIFASMIYFRTMSDLTTMTTTSREALVVFAENVDTVNASLDKLKGALLTQEKLLEQNDLLINELRGLREATASAGKMTMASMQDSSDQISVSNENLANAVSATIAKELKTLSATIGRQISSVEVSNASAMSELARSVENAKTSDKVSANQSKMMDRINSLADQNTAIMRKFEERDNRVSYP